MPVLDDPGRGGGTALADRVEEFTTTDLPWQVLLWNDPINLTDYVTATLTRVLKVDKETAERFMLLAHTNGKTAVKDGDLDTCQDIATQLMAASLWATLQKAGA